MQSVVTNRATTCVCGEVLFAEAGVVDMHRCWRARFVVHTRIVCKGGRGGTPADSCNGSGIGWDTLPCKSVMRVQKDKYGNTDTLLAVALWCCPMCLAGALW